MQILQAILLAILVIAGEPDHVYEGYTSRYSADVMEATVELRQSWGQLPEDLSMYDGFIASLDCSWIGDDVYIKRVSKTSKKESDFERFLVADCAVRDDSDGTRTWMQQNNIIAELDYDTAVRYNAIDGGVYIQMLHYDTADLYE